MLKIIHASPAVTAPATGVPQTPDSDLRLADLQAFAGRTSGAPQNLSASLQQAADSPKSPEQPVAKRARTESAAPASTELTPPAGAAPPPPNRAPTESAPAPSTELPPPGGSSPSDAQVDDVERYSCLMSGLFRLPEDVLPDKFPWTLWCAQQGQVFLHVYTEGPKNKKFSKSGHTWVQLKQCYTTEDNQYLVLRSNPASSLRPEDKDNPFPPDFQVPLASLVPDRLEPSPATTDCWGYLPAWLMSSIYARNCVNGLVYESGPECYTRGGLTTSHSKPASLDKKTNTLKLLFDSGALAHLPTTPGATSLINPATKLFVLQHLMQIQTVRLFL